MTKETFVRILYEENRDFLHAICRKKAGYLTEYDDLIEDCIQDTFVLAMKESELLMSHVNVRGWLALTCLNRLKTMLRKQRTRQQMLAFSLDDERMPDIEGEDCVDIYLASESSHSYLTHLMAALTPDERVLFTAYFINHYTMKAIADQQHTTENKIKNQLKRIRRKAKKLHNIENNFS